MYVCLYIHVYIYIYIYTCIHQAGKPAGLTNDDWGVGEIPDCRAEEGGGVGKMSKCAVGSSFGMYVCMCVCRLS